MTGLLCPTCSGPNHAVTKTDTHGEFIRRIRHCADCGRDFTTYEGAGRAGGRFMQAMHLHHTLAAMPSARRRIVESLIEELGGDE